MVECQPFTYGVGFVAGTLNFADCHAQKIGVAGYQAISASQSVFVSGMLVLFVAFYGYRMLLGQIPYLRSVLVAFVKMGFVLALAASWPAYRILVYDVALRTPAELASKIGGASGVPGARTGLVARLQGADDALVALGKAGMGWIGADVPLIMARDGETAPKIERHSDALEPWAMGGARFLYLSTTVTAFAVTRLIAGMLLALGPIFVAFLLFDTMRGWFEGWLRVLVGTILAGTAAALVSGVELALLEPWLTELMARRAARLAITGAPNELLIFMMIFALVMAAVLTAMMRVAMAFQLPRLAGWPDVFRQSSAPVGTEPRQLQIPAPETETPPRSRARSLAEVVLQDDRREAAGSNRIAPLRVGRGNDGGLSPEDVPAPLLNRAARRTYIRRSASVAKRNALK